MALLIQKDAVMERWELGPLSCGPLGSGDTKGAVGVGPSPEKAIHPDPSGEWQVEQGGGGAMQMCGLCSLLILGTTG